MSLSTMFRHSSGISPDKDAPRFKRRPEAFVMDSEILTKRATLRAYEVFSTVTPDLYEKLSHYLIGIQVDRSIDFQIDVTIDLLKTTNLNVHKHHVDNYLHGLTQSGVLIKQTGYIMASDEPTKYTVNIPNGTWSLSVRHPSATIRTLWLNSIMAYFVHSYTTLLLIQDATHEMDPKQAIEDTLVETEVIKTAENTQITQEVDDSQNLFIDTGNTLQEIATTEQLSRLAPIAERYVRVFDTSQSFSITDTPNLLKFQLDLPNGLYTFFDSTLVSALRSYTLIKTDIEILIKVNANQAQCGRYIVTAFPCRNQIMDSDFATSDNVYRAVQRDHAIVDISSSNDVYMKVTYENLRPWLPIQTDEIGTVTGGSFSTLTMRCLSPMRIADSGNPVCPYQVFARLSNTVLTGMRFPVSLPPVAALSVEDNNVFEVRHEMAPPSSPPTPSKVDSTLKTVVSTLKDIPVFGKLFGITGKLLGGASISLAKMIGTNQESIKEFEDRLIYIGMVNRDRPIDISHPRGLLPNPVHNYSYGRLPYVSKKMRLEPEATTPHMPDHDTVNDTTNIRELCQIPGFVTRFEVNETNSQGDLLAELPAIPYDPRYLFLYPTVREGTIQMPPVTYFFNMFNFYSGSIVYEFVPVKTPSHNFSIQVGFIPFNGAPGEVTEAQLQSCRWKVLDFRTSQNGQFTVPWLSLNVMRTSPTSQSSVMSMAGSFNVPPAAATVVNTYQEFKDPGKVVVRLVNELNPTPIVSPTIEVLVFVKAHPNLRYLTPTSQRAVIYGSPALLQIARSHSANSPGSGPALIPQVQASNTYLQDIRFEMDGVQHGDEQTMDGSILRDAPGTHVQTLETHNDILDINRRFYYYTTLEGVFAAAEETSVTRPLPPSACVPIGPYSIKPLAMNKDEGPNIPHYEMIKSPRESLLPCFRWMRGSIDIVVHSLTDIPLEVTFLPANDYPQSYTGLVDASTPSALYTSTTSIPLYSVPQNVGQPTEVIEPRVNPILTLEAPMYNVNNYIDLQALLSNPRTTITPAQWTAARDDFIDLSANYLGNLVVKGINGESIPLDEIPQNNFKVRVLTAFGDDCVLHHFLGVPPVRNDTQLLQYTVASTAVSFKDRARTRQEISTELVAAGIESNPGPVCGFFPENGLSGLKKAFTTSTGMISDLKRTLRAPTELINSVASMKSHGASILEQVKVVLAAYTEGIDALDLATLAMSIMSALQKETNIYALLTVICQILKLTGVFHLKALTTGIERIAYLFSNSTGKDITHEMESDTIQSMSAVFTALFVESYCAYKSVDKSKINIDEPYMLEVFKKAFKNFNVMRTGALCVMLTRICSAVRTLYKTARKWIRGLERHDLLTDDPAFIQGFMTDYEFFMDEKNLSGQSLQQCHRDRFWTTVLTAYYLKGILATVDRKYINSTLQTAVREIITRANQLKSHMTAPPVRYEPFSLWFWGQAGTGKTTMMQSITVDMAKNIGVHYQGDPIYVRSPHSVWWNGYDNQPIILYDDANGVDDPIILGRNVSEYQAIKTSAKMRIEMPRLEEKNAENTSIILAVCSNVHEWKSTMIVDKTAFRRRRDILVNVVWSNEAEEFFRKTPGKQRTAEHLPKAMTKDNRHIRFIVSSNPAADCITGTSYNYDQLRKLLFAQHKAYHELEVEKMMVRYEKSLSLSKQLSERVMDKTTLKTALMGVLLGCESTEVVSETMRRQMYELKQVSPERFSQLPTHTRNILERMSTTDIQHQIDGILDASDVITQLTNIDPQATRWFRETLLPAYTIGETFITRQDQLFRPWNYEQARTFDQDLITTPCAACQSNHVDGERTVGSICPRSVLENQHWYCNLCEPQAHDNICPTCRNEGMVRITTGQVTWRYHNKVWYMAKTLAKTLTTPLYLTIPILWEHAGFVSAIMLAAYRIYRYRQELARVDTWNQDVADFINYYHVLPERTALVDGETLFQLDGRIFKRSSDHGGAFQMVDEPTYRIGLEMAKGKDKKDKPSTSAKPFDNLPRDVNGDEFKVEVVNWKDTEKHDDVQSSSGSERDFKSPLPIDFDFLKHLNTAEDCNETHNDRRFMEAYLRQDRPVIFYEDNTYMMNERISGKETETYTIKNVKCNTDACGQHQNVIFAAMKFYEQRYGTWISRYNKSKRVFDDDDEAPENVQLMFREQYPEHVASPPLNLYQRMISYQVSLLIGLRGFFLSWFTTIYEVICEKWNYIISMICLVFALYYGYKYYYTEDGEITLETKHESSYSKETAKSRNMKPNTRTFKRNPPPVHELKLSMNTRLPELIKTIGNMIMVNKFTMTCAGLTAQGFVVMNNIGIFSRHAYSLMATLQEERNPVVLNRGDQQILITQRLGMHIIEDNVRGDYVLLQHKQLTGKDIRHHIFTTVMDEVSYPPYAYAVDLQNEEIKPVQVIAVTQTPDEEAQEVTSNWSVNGKKYEYTSKMTDYMTVSGLQGEGKCGSPLLNPDGKIISIHFAGVRTPAISQGYSYPIFKEQFMDLINPEPAVTKHEMSDLPNLEFYAHYPNPPYHTQGSKIQPSAIADKAWKSVTQPCIQSAKDPRYKFDKTPLEDGASTIGAYTNPPDEYALQAAIKAVSDEMIKYMPTPAMNPPVSIFEAVSSANHFHSEPMNLNSSAGLPWIADYPGKNLKSDYIKYQQSSDGVHRVELDLEFDKVVNNHYKQRLAGIPVRDPFWAHLKDERRKPEKLESYGGTRVFHVAPLECMLASRRALLPFMDAYQSDPVRLHHAIGLSPDSTQWTDLIESLRKKSDKIIQLDFSKFSDSMPWSFVSGVFDVIKNYYNHYCLMSRDLENLLSTIYFEITQSLICVGRDVYEIKNGVLQGHPLTAILNSLVNTLEQVYVWIRLTGENGSNFFRKCGLVVMGDDVVISVPKPMLKRYNGQLIAEEFATMLIKVTDESKSSEKISPFQPIQRLTFLSCSYMLHPYREVYLAPSDPASIFDTALWIKRKDGPFMDATYENVEQSLMNCFGHGPCIYEMYRATLEFLTGMHFRNWFELDYIFFKDQGNPRRSIIETNLGFITGTSPKDRSLLGARIGRIEEEYVGDNNNQYWNVDLLSKVKLDTHGIVTGQYKCHCRYDCERELLDRIEQVEQNTCTPRTRFLPFTSQEAGTRILGARIDQARITEARGYPLTIATALTGVASNTIIGTIDGMRDRVEEGPKFEGSILTVFPVVSVNVTRPGYLKCED